MVYKIKFLLLFSLLFMFKCSTDKQDGEDVKIDEDISDITVPVEDVEVTDPDKNLAVSQISAGYKHVLLIDKNSTIFGWGSSASYELGFKSDIVKPKKLNDDKWKVVSSGYESSLLIRQDGTLWAMGYNNSGQLGLGTSKDATQLMQVGTENTWSSVSLGYRHALGLKQNGTLWAWGYNEFFQLGDGTDEPKLAPVQIGKDTDWVAVSAGNKQSFAIKKDGTLWAWGYNFYGQLGVGHNANTAIPTKVLSVLKWKKVVAGITTTGGIKEDGSLWLWGKNYHGELGNGLGALNNEHHSSIPLEVKSVLPWKFLSLGNGNVLAIKQDNTLWAWGKNLKGELGLGGVPSYRTYKNIPTQIGLDSDWESVSAGEYFTIAKKINGSYYGWGTSNYGQVPVKKDNLTFPTIIYF